MEVTEEGMEIDLNKSQREKASVPMETTLKPSHDAGMTTRPSSEVFLTPTTLQVLSDSLMTSKTRSFSLEIGVPYSNVSVPALRHRKQE